MATEFAAMSVINLALVFGLRLVERILGITDQAAPLLPTVFFVALLTVLIVLFDRFHAVFVARGLLERSPSGDGRSPESVMDGG